MCWWSESALSIYRLAARLVVGLATVLIIYWMARDNLTGSNIPPFLLVGIFFLCLYLTSYCSDINALVADALLICVLAEAELDYGRDFSKLSRCPDVLKQRIIELGNFTEDGSHF